MRKLLNKKLELPFSGVIAFSLVLLSFTLLCFSQVLVWYMWFYAYRKGIYPNGLWDTGYRGGPWANEPVLEACMSRSGLAVLAALLLAFFSVVIKPHQRSLVALALSVCCFFVLLLHIGLVED